MVMDMEIIQLGHLLMYSQMIVHNGLIMMGIIAEIIRTEIIRTDSPQIQHSAKILMVMDMEIIPTVETLICLSIFILNGLILMVMV